MDPVCEHCGGLVDDDGMAVTLEEPVEVEAAPEEKKPARDFAKAVESRKEG